MVNDIFRWCGIYIYYRKILEDFIVIENFVMNIYVVVLVEIYFV